jgi:hypothetical protein
VDEGALDEPDVIVLPLGTGGTVAGLLAGLYACGLRSWLSGVEVAMGKAAGRTLVAGLTRWVARRENLRARRSLTERLAVDDRFLGRGYGWELPHAQKVRQSAGKLNLQLDSTYTTKAFAKALELGRFPGYDSKCWPSRQADSPLERAINSQSRGSRRPLRVLYWHTLSCIEPSTPASASQRRADLPTELMKQFLTR